MFSHEEIIDIPVHNDNKIGTWRIFNMRIPEVQPEIRAAQNWKHSAIISAVRRAGINIPRRTWRHKDIVTVQNDLADGIIYIQLLGQEWLTLREVL